MKLLSLDLSTTCTGYAVFNGKKLTNYGIVKPKVKGVTNMVYPKQPLAKMESIAEQILGLIKEHDPDQIVIEEINRSKNRIGQKVLDGLHFIILYYIWQAHPHLLDSTVFMDSNGKTGWRTVLKLALTKEERIYNKEAKAFNRKLPKRADNKRHVVGWKHLSSRHVRRVYKLDLNVDEFTWHGDVSDAIALGDAYLKTLDKHKKL